MRTPGFTGQLAASEAVIGQLFGPVSVINTNTGASGNITGVATDLGLGAGDAILFLTGAQSGGVNYVLPTVAVCFASLQGFANIDLAGSSYWLRIINNATTQTITVTTNTGWTLAAGGLFTIANNTYRDFVVNFTSGTTATITDIGLGTYT